MACFCKNHGCYDMLHMVEVDFFWPVHSSHKIPLCKTSYITIEPVIFSAQFNLALQLFTVEADPANCA
jgi:hypothetical protein